jgi:hypothetical protein
MEPSGDLRSSTEADISVSWPFRCEVRGSFTAPARCTLGAPPLPNRPATAPVPVKPLAGPRHSSVRVSVADLRTDAKRLSSTDLNMLLPAFTY